MRLTLLKNALVVTVLLTSCSRNFNVDRGTVEAAHGVKLPLSAHNFQQRSCGAAIDKGIVSFVEMDAADLKEFAASLKINSRSGPINSGAADPTVNGYNVWPKRSSTFVPGNVGQLKKTWAGDAVPVEMLSCQSTKGDWLHVEVWAVGKATLVKLYTDWN